MQALRRMGGHSATCRYSTRIKVLVRSCAGNMRMEGGVICTMYGLRAQGVIEGKNRYLRGCREKAR